VHCWGRSKPYRLAGWFKNTACSLRPLTQRFWLEVPFASPDQKTETDSIADFRHYLELVTARDSRRWVLPSESIDAWSRMYYVVLRPRSTRKSYELRIVERMLARGNKKMDFLSSAGLLMSINIHATQVHKIALECDSYVCCMLRLHPLVKKVSQGSAHAHLHRSD
jgi:hypothetical protein